MTKHDLEALKGQSDLKDVVVDYYLQVMEDEGLERMKDFMGDVVVHGCASGIVGELIYYKDTLAFYDKHRNDINILVKCLMLSWGLDQTQGLGRVFGEDWDNEDPLALETQNQNLLSWFAWERMTQHIMYDLGISL